MKEWVLNNLKDFLDITVINIDTLNFKNFMKIKNFNQILWNFLKKFSNLNILFFYYKFFWKNFPLSLIRVKIFESEGKHLRATYINLIFLPSPVKKTRAEKKLTKFFNVTQINNFSSFNLSPPVEKEKREKERNVRSNESIKKGTMEEESLL